MSEPEIKLEIDENYEPPLEEDRTHKPVPTSLGRSGHQYKEPSLIEEIGDSAARFGVGVTDMLTLGNTDYLARKMGQMLGIQPEKTEKNIAETRAHLASQEGINKAPEIAGNVAGFLTGGALLPGATTVKGVAAQGAALGAASDLQSVEDMDVSQMAMNAALGAGGGLALKGAGAAIKEAPKLLKGKVKAADNLAEIIQRRMQERSTPKSAINKILDETRIRRSKEGYKILKEAGAFGKGGLGGPKKLEEVVSAQMAKFGSNIEDAISRADIQAKASGVPPIKGRDMLDAIDNRIAALTNKELKSHKDTRILNAMTLRWKALNRDIRNKNFTFDEAWKYTSELGESINFDKANKPAMQEAEKIIREEIRDTLTGKMMTLDETLGQQFAENSYKYSALAPFKKAAKEAVTASQGGGSAQIGDLVALGGGHQAGGTVGGLASVLARRAYNKFGSRAATTLMEKDISAKVAQKILGWSERTAVKKIGKPALDALTAAAEESNAAYNAQVFMLMQSDPNFRKQFREKKEDE